MASVPVSNTVLCEVRQTMELQQCENTLYFHKSSGWTVSEMDDLGDGLIDWWSSDIAPLVWAGVELREIAVTDLSSAIAPGIARTPTAPVFGARDLDHLPNNVSLAISFRTANRGRSYRGRNYLLGFTEDQADGSVIHTSEISAYVAAYNDLRTVATDNSCSWVVVSRFSGVDPLTKKPIPRTVGISTPITSVVVVDNVVDSQRNRLPGRGN